MRIAISGPHGQGKTTLINTLKEIEEFNNFTFVPSPTRTISSTHSINEKGTQDTQVAIMFQHYINQMNDNVILDRCALDGIAYTRYFEKHMNSNVISAIYNLYSYLIPRYDIIFYTEPEIPLVSDGTRSVSIEFFNTIIKNFEIFIRRDKIKITSLSGNNEQRVKKVLDTFNIYKTIKKI